MAGNNMEGPAQRDPLRPVCSSCKQQPGDNDVFLPADKPGLLLWTKKGICKDSSKSLGGYPILIKIMTRLSPLASAAGLLLDAA